MRFIGIVFLFLFLVSCDEQIVQEATTPNISLPTLKLTKSSVIVSMNYIADIESVRNVEIRSRLGGYIESIAVDEGQEVEENQLLFKLNDEYFQNELSKANANYKIALSEVKLIEIEARNTQLLVDKGVLNQIELDAVQAKLEAAQAKLENAKSLELLAELNIRYTEIRAPFKGVLNRIPFKEGSYISDGTLLTSLSDLSYLNVYFNVSENEYLAFKKNSRDSTVNGQEVDLILVDGSIYSEKGIIETIEGEFESGTGAIAFRAKFKNSNKILKHNATGKIRLKQNLEDVFIIPQKSVFEIQEKYFVFKVNEENIVEATTFVPMFRKNDFYIVNSDEFEIGDAIVLEGTQKIKDGNEIVPEIGSFTISKTF
jgi:membrane fusion protein (multidrug efflux system)